MDLPINIDPTNIRALCEKHHVSKLSLFGSVLRPDFRPDSDVDMVVEFLPEATPTFIDLMKLQAELSDLLGRKVDLRTPSELSRHFKDQVLQDALVQYAA